MARAKQRPPGKNNVSKASSATNLQCTRVGISSCSPHSLGIEKFHISPHMPHQSRRAERFALALVAIMSFVLIIQQLLLLSGNVERNPGPLGQHNKDPTFTFKNVIRAIKPVVEWKPLGDELEISPAKIKEIDVNNHGQVAECQRDMVQFWLESDTSCSWKKLIDALISINQSVLAEVIRNTYCHSSQNSPEKSLPISAEGASKSIRVRNFGAGTVIRMAYTPPPPSMSYLLLNLNSDSGEILLHINPRYYTSGSVLVLNSFLNGGWGAEETPTGFPFGAAAMNVVVVVEEGGYRITANGGSFQYLYKHRRPLSLVTSMTTVVDEIQHGAQDCF